MNNQKVMELLRNKFNAHFGYTEAMTVTTNTEEIDYPTTVKELKLTETEIAKAEQFLANKKVELKAKIIREGEQARKNAKGREQLNMANRDLSNSIMKLDFMLSQDDEYANTLSKLTEMKKKQGQLLLQKEKFETENTDVINQLRKERVRKQLEELDMD